MTSVCTCEANPTVGIVCQRRVRLHRRDGPQRVGARTVEIEDHQRRRALPHLGRAPRRAERAKRHRHAELRGGRLDLDVNIRSSSDGQDHATMILETQAVGPFYKNGFVVGCERTREAVLIDPGDEVEQLLGVRGASGAGDPAHPADPRARRSRHRRGRGQGCARRAGLPAPRRSLSLRARASSRARCSACASSRSRRSTCSTTPGQVIHVRRLRGATAPHAGPLSRRRLPAGRTEPATAGTDLFVGDTLFAGSIGRTDLPGGDYETLIARSRTVLFPLGDDARSSTRDTARTRRSGRSARPIRFWSTT